MSDLTMCKGTDCPLKDNCYRNTAIINPWRQSFFVLVPYNKEKNSCDNFWFDDASASDRIKRQMLQEEWNAKYEAAQKPSTLQDF